MFRIYASSKQGIARSLHGMPLTIEEKITILEKMFPGRGMFHYVLLLLDSCKNFDECLQLPLHDRLQLLSQARNETLNATPLLCREIVKCLSSALDLKDLDVLVEQAA